MHTKTAERLFLAAKAWQDNEDVEPMRCPRDGRKLVPYWDTNLFELVCPQCHYTESDLTDRPSVMARYKRSNSRHSK